MPRTARMLAALEAAVRLLRQGLDVARRLPGRRLYGRRHPLQRPDTSTYHISPGDLDEGIKALLVFRGAGDVERQARLGARQGFPRGRHRRGAVLPGLQGSRSGWAGHGRRRALTDPRRDAAAHIGRARHREAAVQQRMLPADVATPDPGQRAQAGFHVPATVAGSKSHTSASPSATTIHQRDAFGATPSRWNASVVRDRGQVSTGMVRRMSHIRRCGSRSSSPSSPIQRTPQAPSASTTSASSFPHWVSEYVVRPSISPRSTTPARASDFSRLTTAQATSWAPRGEGR